MQVKKQQLEPVMKQQTGSKLGMEYVKAIFCQNFPPWPVLNSIAHSFIELDKAQ